MKPGVFVKTPAYEAAINPLRGICFFVGRRGTGKTALAQQLGEFWKSAIHVHPVAFLASEWALVVCFRGEIKVHYFEHIKRVASDKDGVILLLGDDDLTVFLRQASNGKVKEGHIREIWRSSLPLV